MCTLNFGYGVMRTDGALRPVKYKKNLVIVYDESVVFCFSLFIAVLCCVDLN